MNSSLFGLKKKRDVALILLVLMTTQYLPIEGYGVSYVKFGAMCLCPVIFLCFSPKLSKALVWGGLYFVTILFSGLFNFESFRLSTVGYALSFIVMFITYYNLVYCEKVFTVDGFMRVLKSLILAYTICLLMQQAVHLVGIESFPLINTYTSYGRGFLAGNSLGIEPSSSARLMAVFFLSLLRMYEVKWGKQNVTIKGVYADAKWVVLGFLWSMLTMGSGTAFVALGILSLYFIKFRYIFMTLPLFVALYLAAPHIKYEPLHRARLTFEAALTLDRETVIQADGSAAARVVPIINTLKNLDLTKFDTWFGKGIDENMSGEYMGEEVMVGSINDYGLLSYILLLALIFSCCIRFFSIENIIFFVLMSANLGNVAYGWGMMMVMATAKFFMDGRLRESDT